MEFPPVFPTPNNVPHELGEAFSALRSQIREDLCTELREVKQALQDIQQRLRVPDTGVLTLVPQISGESVQDSTSLSEGNEDEEKEMTSRMMARTTSLHGGRSQYSKRAGYMQLLDDRHEELQAAIFQSKRPTLSKGVTTNFAERRKRKFKFALLQDSQWDLTNCSSLEDLLESRYFETLVGFVVLLNAIFIGIEANAQCVYHLHPPGKIPQAFQFAEILFMTFFFTEWCLRLRVYGCEFFYMDGWATNVFDTVVLALQVFEQCLALHEYIFPHRDPHAADSSEGVVGLIRIMRLIRIVRMARLLHLFTELGMLIASIVQASHTLLWALTLLFVFLYAFSVFFALSVSQSTHGEPADDLAYFFGDVPRTGLTLMECILGGVGWDQPLMVLFTEVGWFPGFLCVIFVATGLFILVNIVSGVFIDRTMKTAAVEEDRKIAEDLAIAFGLSEDGVTWSKNFMCDQSICFDEFKEKKHEPTLRRYFQKIDLEVDDHHLRKFFNLLDVDGSGDVTAEEMYAGCLRLRGAVRAVDLALFSFDQQELLKHQSGRLHRLEDLLWAVSQKLNVKIPKQNNGRRNARPGSIPL